LSNKIMSESKKPRSLVWNYFTAGENCTAICNLCNKSFKRPSGNTSNLTAHLEREHRREHQELREEELRRKNETEALQQVSMRSLMSTVRDVKGGDVKF